jgi:hypothetical protein
MRYNQHDALKKVVAYYKRKHKNVKTKVFGYDFKFLSLHK